MFLAEKAGKPVEIKPPNWIREKLGQRKAPGLAMRQQTAPREPGRRLLRIAPDIIQLRGRDARMPGGAAINGPPQCKPDKAKCPGADKSPAPAKTHGQPWHQNRRNCSA